MNETVLAGLSGLVVLSGIIVILTAVARERKLSNLKSEFVANVSHELKTPLSLVRMFGEMLHSGRVENEEKRRQYLQIIVNESERLGALIENVLDFARVERGKDSFVFKLAKLDDLVTRVFELCRARVERDGLVLELESRGELPEVSIDEHAIEVAILNLVDNAVKYAAAGKVIRIAIERREDLIRIRVEDHGPGISPEDRRRIFERFVRGKATGRVRGSGIGLALVKQIALAHGGDAGVEAVEPTGAAFFFTIRLGRQQRNTSG
jgi:two-component system phosphate regulon sensor histidine kinase PhoR